MTEDLPGHQLRAGYRALVAVWQGKSEGRVTAMSSSAAARVRPSLTCFSLALFVCDNALKDMLQLGDIVHGETRGVLGTAGQTQVPPVPLEADASTATSLNPALLEHGRGALTPAFCCTGCCNSEIAGFAAHGLALNPALNFTDEFCSLTWTVPGQCNKVLILPWAC